MTHMVKDGLKRGRKGILWTFLAIPVMAGTVWLETSQAGPPEADPAMQAGAGAKASAPTKKKAAKKATTQPTRAAAQVPKTPEVAGRRDPFRLPGPPVQATAGGEQPLGPLPPGTRGLVIGQLRVEGIVRLDSTNTLIAVVDNNNNRAYFLRENDAVYNGVVAKITPDSVIFRENALDQSGRVITREVVKRLGQGPGA